MCRTAQRKVERQARDAAINAKFEPRVCGRCAVEKPASAFAYGGYGYLTRICLSCKQKQTLWTELGWQEVEQAPDPSPAMHLRGQLANARANGEPFIDAWGDCVEYVCSCLPPREADEWRAAFAATAGSWWLGWSRITFTALSDELVA